MMFEREKERELHFQSIVHHPSPLMHTDPLAVMLSLHQPSFVVVVVQVSSTSETRLRLTKGEREDAS